MWFQYGNGGVREFFRSFYFLEIFVDKMKKKIIKQNSLYSMMLFL